MSFAKRFPNVTALLGEKAVAEIDEHAVLVANSDHLKNCKFVDWCALANQPEFVDQLELIELSIGQIIQQGAVEKNGVFKAFRTKSLNPDQFPELLAEIATAASVSEKAKAKAKKPKSEKGQAS